jgi:uncharacterized protein (TIGR03382 family)
MTFSWALSVIGQDPNWTEFATDVPVEGAGFELAYEPTIEVVSSSVMIRVEVSDPLDRTWTAHAIEYIAVTEDVGDEGCDGGSFISNPCDTDTGETGATGDEVGDDPDETGPTLSEDGESNCNCSTRVAPNAVASLALLVILAQLRRRRSPAMPSKPSKPSSAKPSAPLLP